VVTLKGPGTVAGGVHEREELELPTAEYMPAGWPGEIRERLQQLIGTPALEPLLEVANHRRTWPLLRGAQVIGEVALDAGTISVGGRSEPMHELEIELKGGTRADLDALSALAQRALPAQPEDRSKFARGLALVGTNLADR
jgi:triphosphatase